MIAVRIRESVGFAVLSAAITRARHERDALVVRIGVEAAGHYHRTLVARLKAAGLEVVELNPRAVKDARGQQLLRTLKNDARDCGAMAELLIPGSGRSPQCRDEALAGQPAWVAHRRRKVAAQVVLANQIHGQLDLIFPGLTGCFAHGLPWRSPKNVTAPNIRLRARSAGSTVRRVSPMPGRSDSTGGSC